MPSSRFEFLPQKDQVSTISEVFGIAEQLRDQYRGDPILWRGQPNASDGLRPTIGRTHVHAGSEVSFDEAAERAMLIRFRRYAYLEHRRSLSQWEVLLLAREHGLPVRLLDWTANPLVALYFACLFGKKPCGNAALWALIRTCTKSLTRGTLVDVFTNEDPLDVPGIRVVYPMAISERTIAQSGIMTIQSDPRHDLESLALCDFDPETLDVVAVLKWDVPAQSRDVLLQELEQLDINQRRLFPDLNGLCMSLWQTEALKQRRGQYANLPPRTTA